MDRKIAYFMVGLFVGGLIGVYTAFDTMADSSYELTDMCIEELKDSTEVLKGCVETLETMDNIIKANEKRICRE